MDQDVAKRDDALVLADLRGEISVELNQPRQRFADDLELALDCRAQHGILRVVGAMERAYQLER
jgi:hypothetical protein